MAAAAAPAPLPVDVRLMNAVANAVFVLAGLALLAAGTLALARQPSFALRHVMLDGELARSSVATVRANVMPHLAGSFWQLDLQRARAAFEAVPWVRQAVVRRVWPDTLAVRLTEHEAVALWSGDDGNDRLVNAQGEVFDANVGDVEDEKLPVFTGPEGSSAAMLAMYRLLEPRLAALDAGIETLRLSRRGSWRVQLDSGAVIELGRGDEAEIAARTERFVRTLAQVNERFQRPLEYADLRHVDGYAVRLKGITTTPPAVAARKK
jgi:cell division protein FtsQ